MSEVFEPGDGFRAQREALVDKYTEALNRFMKEKLAKNEHKGGLDKEDGPHIWECIDDENREFRQAAYAASKKWESTKEALRELADVNNYYMEIMRRIGGL